MRHIPGPIALAQRMIEENDAKMHKLEEENARMKTRLSELEQELVLITEENELLKEALDHHAELEDANNTTQAQVVQLRVTVAQLMATVEALKKETK